MSPRPAKLPPSTNNVDLLHHHFHLHRLKHLLHRPPSPLQGEEDVEWKRDLSAAGGGGELTVVPTDGGVSPSGVMLGEAGIQGSSRRCHDSSQLEHHPRGPGTHSSKDIRGTALASSKNKLLNHLDTFAGTAGCCTTDFLTVGAALKFN